MTQTDQENACLIGPMMVASVCTIHTVNAYADCTYVFTSNPNDAGKGLTQFRIYLADGGPFPESLMNNVEVPYVQIHPPALKG